MEGKAPDSYLNRIIRAAKLDVSLYREVEADPGAILQAMGVVILASVAAGVGATPQTGAGLGLILLGSGSALASWFVWAFLTYFIGTRLLPEPQTRANYGQLLRTIGFASAPGIIRILGLIPGTTLFLFVASDIWMLVAMVIAVRVALNYSNTLRAVGVCAIGWLIATLIFVLVQSLLFGGFSAPGT